MALAFGGAIASDAHIASAASPQPGTVRCAGVTGVVRFHPPLTSTGTAPEVASISMTLSHCTAGGGAVTPQGGSGSAVFSPTTNSCSDVTARSRVPVSLAISWSPRTDGRSEIRFPGYVPLDTARAGVKLGGRGTRATGSYTGANEGASSTARVIWDVSSSQIAAACAATSGLRVLKIDSGSLSLA